MATVYKHADSIVAHLDGVVDAVHEAATSMARRGQRILAAHTNTGAAKVTVTRGRTDSFVNLEDPGGAAHVIEYGRPAGVSASGRRYGAREPLHILARAVGEA